MDKIIFLLQLKLKFIIAELEELEREETLRKIKENLNGRLLKVATMQVSGAVMSTY